MNYLPIIVMTLIACSFTASAALCVGTAEPKPSVKSNKREQSQIFGDSFDVYRVGSNPNTKIDELMVWDVRIEGNRLIPSSEILRVIKSKRGDKFIRDNVAQDLKAINGLGYFDSQTMCVPELDSHGVILKIRVHENPPVFVSQPPVEILLTSDGEFKPLSNLYVGNAQYLPRTFSNAFQPRGYRVLNTASWERSVRKFVDPTFFQIYKLGQSYPTIARPRSATSTPGGLYGLKSPPKDLLPAVLLRNEHKCLPYETAPEFF